MIELSAITKVKIFKLILIVKNMTKYGLKIETFQSAGRFQHKVYEYGIGPKNRIESISNEVVEAQQKVNEKLYEQMPEGATGLVAIIQYKSTKK